MTHCIAPSARRWFQRLEDVSEVVSGELVEFEELQRVVEEYLDANSSSRANEM